MSHLLESLMYQASQVFLFPTLVVITVLFVYAFFLLGMFAMQWWQRRQGQGGQPTRGHHLLAWAQAQPGASADELDVKAHQLLELPRIATRVAPMLGLVATMIPMGPALKALADGQLADVSRSLMVAFSAVILALLAAAISFTVVNVRKRWYAADLAAIEQDMAPAPPAHAEGLAPLTEATA